MPWAIMETLYGQATDDNPNLHSDLGSHDTAVDTMRNLVAGTVEPDIDEGLSLVNRIAPNEGSLIIFDSGRAIMLYHLTDA